MKELTKTFLIDDHIYTGKNKKRRVSLNLNIYRNLHFQVSNSAKVNFLKKLLFDYPEIENIIAERVEISYAILKRNNRSFDTMNIISIADKFFLDALVSVGCIKDDNYKVVSYGSISVIEELQKKENQIYIFCRFYIK